MKVLLRMDSWTSLLRTSNTASIVGLYCCNPLGLWDLAYQRRLSDCIPLRLTWPFLFWSARDSRTKSLADGFHTGEQSFSECGDSVSSTTNCSAHTISGAFSHR